MWCRVPPLDRRRRFPGDHHDAVQQSHSPAVGALTLGVGRSVTHRGAQQPLGLLHRRALPLRHLSRADPASMAVSDLPSDLQRRHGPPVLHRAVGAGHGPGVGRRRERVHQIGRLPHSDIRQQRTLQHRQDVASELPVLLQHGIVPILDTAQPQPRGPVVRPALLHGRSHHRHTGHRHDRARRQPDSAPRHREAAAVSRRRLGGCRVRHRAPDRGEQFERQPRNRGDDRSGNEPADRGAAVPALQAVPGRADQRAQGHQSAAEQRSPLNPLLKVLVHFRYVLGVVRMRHIVSRCPQPKR